MVCFTINSCVNSKCKKWEKFILSMPWDCYVSQKAYEYSRRILKSRWKEAEPAILKNPHFSYLYARHVMNARWKEAEESIAKNSSGYHYAKFVIGGRFPLFEESCKKKLISFRDMYLYSKYVIKERWNLLENNFEKRSKGSSWVDVQSIVDYIRFIKKSRWAKLETHIANSRHIHTYMGFLNQDEKEEFKNKLIIEAMQPKNYWEPTYAQDYLKKGLI